MDKIEKALQKLSPREREAIRRLLEQLNHKAYKGLDIKKLQGYENIFRVRKGNIRIIYQQEDNGKVRLIAIERRREDTYKF